jgi:hypothetical protein
MARKATLLFVLIILVWPIMAADPPDNGAPEFVFARLIYSSGLNGSFRGRRNAWATDFPEADYKFMYGIQRLSNVRVQIQENPVHIMDPELFRYPFLYAVEVGQMTISMQEAERLREYLLRGGFLYADDFWGLYQKQNFLNQMRKVFPDRAVATLPLSHEVFHTFFDIDHVMQIPNVSNGCNGRRTWQDSSDIVPTVLGLNDDTGRLMVMATYNSDLGDAWEWMDEPCYPALFSGQAYRMGLNFILYAMSH